MPHKNKKFMKKILLIFVCVVTYMNIEKVFCMDSLNYTGLNSTIQSKTELIDEHEDQTRAIDDSDEKYQEWLNDRIFYSDISYSNFSNAQDLFERGSLCMMHSSYKELVDSVLHALQFIAKYKKDFINFYINEKNASIFGSSFALHKKEVLHTLYKMDIGFIAGKTLTDILQDIECSRLILLKNKQECDNAIQAIIVFSSAYNYTIQCCARMKNSLKKIWYDLKYPVTTHAQKYKFIKPAEEFANVVSNILADWKYYKKIDNDMIKRGKLLQKEAQKYEKYVIEYLESDDKKYKKVMDKYKDLIYKFQIAINNFDKIQQNNIDEHDDSISTISTILSKKKQ